MLLLTFGVSGCRYAVDVRRVVEVVPRIPLRPVPHAPAYVAGLFNHGGTVVPVLDLGLLLTEQTSPARLSTRIILVEFSVGLGRTALLGLIAEDVTELRSLSDDQVTARAVPPALAPYMGPIVQIDVDLIQMIVIDRLLPDALRDMLYGGMLGLPA